MLKPKEKVGKFIGRIEGEEGEFVCMVYYNDEARTQPPIGWVIGYAIKNWEKKV